MKKTIIALALCLICASAAQAKITLPRIMASDMVLQQQSEVNIWGKTDKNRTVKVTTSWNGKTYRVQPDADGNWMAKVSTPAAGGPYEVSISDGEEVKLTNILIGEVWFCCGQSNMEMPMGGFDRQPLVGTNNIIAKAKPSTPIRVFDMDNKWMHQYSKTPQEDCIGEWWTNTPEHVAATSAAAYYFAMYIQEVLNVPVGLIVSTWGGSRIEAWMSRECIEPFGKNLSILTNDKEVRNPTATPCVLYNAKINPLLNYNIKGMLWYQGESNRDNAAEYESLMPAFVSDLRARWNVGEFPVYFVEIAPYDYEGPDGTSAARFREAQSRNLRDIPNCGMATTVDAGVHNFIHPVNKEVVGERLALLALAKTYGKTGFGYAAPLYKSMDVIDGKVYLNFENAERGLCPMWTSLKGFEIAGEDRVFHPAFAEIETKSCRLAVSSKEVPNPVAVRYAYHNYPEISVYAINGLPVIPFRTDNW